MYNYTLFDTKNQAPNGNPDKELMQNHDCIRHRVPGYRKRRPQVHPAQILYIPLPFWKNHGIIALIEDPIGKELSK